jgi:hypothetical protein
MWSALPHCALALGVLAASVAAQCALHAGKARRAARGQPVCMLRGSLQVANYALVGGLVAGCVALDHAAPPPPGSAWALVPLKGWAVAYAVCVLDLAYSSVTYISVWESLKGASCWMACSAVGLWFSEQFLGLPVTIVEPRAVLSVTQLSFEYAVLLTTLVVRGLLTDLAFSPLHRIEHRGKRYARSHKRHHEFTDNLTSMVLFYGTLFDDLLMPATTIVGAVGGSLLFYHTQIPLLNPSNRELCEAVRRSRADSCDLMRPATRAGRSAERQTRHAT